MTMPIPWGKRCEPPEHLHNCQSQYPIECEDCDGSGVIFTSAPTIPQESWKEQTEDCPHCGGEGEYYLECDCGMDSAFLLDYDDTL